MSKKARRVRRPERTNLTNDETSSEDKRTRKEISEDEFAREYAYVLKDLRTIFILAGAMFLLLIVLNIIF